MKIARHLIVYEFFRQLKLKKNIQIRAIFCDNKVLVTVNNS
jgi:urease gamma subunit